VGLDVREMFGGSFLVQSDLLGRTLDRVASTTTEVVPTVPAGDFAQCISFDLRSCARYGRRLLATSSL